MYDDEPMQKSMMNEGDHPEERVIVQIYHLPDKDQSENDSLAKIGAHLQTYIKERTDVLQRDLRRRLSAATRLSVKSVIEKKLVEDHKEGFGRIYCHESTMSPSAILGIRKSASAIRPKQAFSPPLMKEVSLVNNRIVADVSRICLLEALKGTECEWEDVSKLSHLDLERNSQPSWWCKPLWAWTWHQRLLGHGILVASDLAKVCRSHATRDMMSSIRLLISNVEDDFTTSELFLKNRFSLRLGKPLSPVQGCDSDQVEVCSLSSSVDEDSGVESLLEKLPDDDSRNTNLDLLKDPLNYIEIGGNLGAEQESNQQSENLVTVNTQKEYPRATTDSALKKLVHEATQEESKIPQIDSQGVDLTILSQLPPKVRAEARLALTVQERQKKRRRSSKNLDSRLYQWLSAPAMSTRKQHQQLLHKSAGGFTKSAIKQKKSIQDFFSGEG